MAIIKCKMCGGDLNIIQGVSTAACEYCGSVQTVPNADDEKKLIQFERAERLRRQCEFDKAAGIYESIVADFRQEAEAYWGLVLCKYGIEYVDDPGDKKVPTCHRTSFNSIMEDTDFEQALENADMAARKLYREEAKQIEEIRKGIIAVSANEDPYDIFICYKETDEKGERTLDSVLAQDVYDALVSKKYRVFFARISLEDKLGSEYEPHIFAALHSAKVMLAFGTDYEYFNAVWVKNEWSRFLKLMETDKSKHLIPCYKGIDAYDMPKEFSKLQAQDLGKVGAVQDLLRGIDKLISPGVATAAAPKGAELAPLLQLGREALENKEWEIASNQFDLALTVDPMCADAHVGKLMAKCKCKERKDLAKAKKSLKKNAHYKQAITYADDTLKKELEGYCHKTVARQRVRILTSILSAAFALFIAAIFIYNIEIQYRSVVAEFYADPAKKAYSSYEQLSNWFWYRKPDKCTQYLLQKYLPGTYPAAANAIDLKIPNTVTHIGDATFSNCSNLTNITIPDGVTHIGNSAFSGCAGLSSIEIPDSVTGIGKAAFYNCTGLTSIVIPDSVTSMSTSTFCGCTSLTSIEIPDSVTSIGDSAFRSCTGLNSFVIPNSVTSIGGSAFSDCTRLTTIEIPDSVTAIGASVFSGCTSLTSIEIPDSVTSIGASAFSGWTGLTSIVIPDSVTSIGDNAFSSCNKLTSIVIPDSVTDIGENAFYNCSGLTSIEIPDSVTGIGKAAFHNCTGLTSIVIPDSVTSIGVTAFSGCSRLKNVYFTGTKEQWEAIKIEIYNLSLTNAQIKYNHVN